ncbi:MAG: DNA polymerase I [Candidatus Kapaibacteriales bacterium]
MEERKEKVILIDGMSVVFRAYHAMSQSQLRTKTNEPTGAVYAFTNIILNLLNKEQPRYIAVLFDTKEPTFRHKLFPEYKANRQAFPEDLEPQLKRIKDILDAFNIRRIEIPGFEADDLIGTLAKKFSEKSHIVFCLTNDKDFFQIVDEKILLYRPTKNIAEGFEIITPQKVIEKYGVPPEQIIDLFAILGDPVDNVPGVKGIGEKTAIPLIQKFASLERLYENLDKIEKESIRIKLKQNFEQALLSRELVKINCNIPFEISLNEIRWNGLNLEKLDQIFRELDFRTFRQKLFPNNFDVSGSEKATTDKVFDTISTKMQNYHLVDSIEAFDDLLAMFQSASEFAIDTETSSLDRQTCELVGISIAFRENEAFYIPLFGLPSDGENQTKKRLTKKEKVSDSLFSPSADKSNRENELHYKIEFTPGKGFDSNQLLPKLKPFLEDERKKKYGQNIKFDAFVLRRYGIELKPIAFDTMVASYILNPDAQHNLEALSEKWLSYTPIPITSLIGEKKNAQISMRALHPEQIKDYACEDADLTLKLTNVLRMELEKNNLQTLAENIEFPLVEVLTKMEFDGVYVSKEILASISEVLKDQIAELSDKIYSEAGMEFNLDSPKQLGMVLFEKLKLPVIAKTKTGYSTDVSVLSQLASSYPIAGNILEYRQRTKLLSTYVSALPHSINPQTGRIHTTFQQTVAATGRLSSMEPNLQNIPIRSEFGKEIRKAFVPQRKGWKILSADYSQIELRIMAYISNDANLINAFKNGLDIHSATASILFGRELTEIDSNMRRAAKTVNFGILYGLGAFGLSQRLNISRTEAQQIIDNYLNKYSGIRRYVEETILDTARRGFAVTLCGRRRYFPNITSQNRNLRSADERSAINFPIQGTAADMMKVAMVNIYRKMQRHRFRSMMILQIHDELLFEVIEDELDELKEIVKTNMQNALSLGDVPVVVDIGVGDSWFDAH